MLMLGASDLLELGARGFRAFLFHSRTVVSERPPLSETRRVPLLKEASSYPFPIRLLISLTETSGWLSRYPEQYVWNEAFESPEILEALALEVSDIVE